MKKNIILTAAICAFAGNFIAYCALLDRCPLPYWDEAFFNYPAMRYLEGKGFGYEIATGAPHWDKVWAWHGPFFPKLQVVAFRLLGFSYFASRIAQLTSAHLAIILLAGLMGSLGRPREAALLMLMWVGDRSCQEVLYGRTEGVALLCVTIGFLALFRTVQVPSLASGAVLAGSLLLAPGFHPLTCLFVFATAVLLPVLTPRQAWPRLALGCSLGALIPFVLLLACCFPYLPESLEQFLWHLNWIPQTGLHRMRRLPGLLAWSKYWIFALVAVTFLLTSLVIFHFRSYRQRAMEGSPDHIMAVAGTAFALAGLGCVVRGYLPYYLVHFTVWPVVGLLAMRQAAPRNSITARLITLGGISLACAWGPSLTWNLTRLREPIIEYSHLDPNLVVSRINSCISPGSRAYVDPITFLYAKRAKLDFEVLPFYGGPDRLDESRFLIITYVYMRWHLGTTLLKGRDILYNKHIFYKAPDDLKVLILAPRTRRAGREVPNSSREIPPMTNATRSSRIPR